MMRKRLPCERLLQLHTLPSAFARAGVHPRNAQALARHSTIDLTMNVYTHVDMGDLAGDVENLPALPGQAGLAVTAPNAVPAAPAAAPAIPSDLASLASNWSALPDHIRQAIATLAGA